MAKVYGNNAHNGNAQLKESMKKRRQLPKEE